MRELMQEERASNVTEHNFNTDRSGTAAKYFDDLDNHWAKDYIHYLMEHNIIPETESGLFYPEDKVTTEEFVTLMARSGKVSIAPMCDSRSGEYMIYALKKGIIDDYDMSNKNNLIERRCVARIVHETLITEFGERDEKDWSAAENLKDLYVCRTCVMHIAQVYVKGIMKSKDNGMFDAVGNITRAEAVAIIVRMLDKGQRIPQTEGRELHSKILTHDEALELLLNNSSAMLIDVRTHEDFTMGHIEGSVCMPLQDISNNPFSVCSRKDTPLIIYCHMGYKSSIAAQILIDAGYRKVYTIPGIGQYQYNLVR